MVVALPNCRRRIVSSLFGFVVCGRDVVWRGLVRRFWLASCEALERVSGFRSSWLVDSVVVALDVLDVVVLVVVRFVPSVWSGVCRFGRVAVSLLVVWFRGSCFVIVVVRNRDLSVRVILIRSVLSMLALCFGYNWCKLMFLSNVAIRFVDCTRNSSRS